MHWKKERLMSIDERGHVHADEELEEETPREGSFSEAEVEATIATVYRDALNKIFEIEQLFEAGKKERALNHVQKLIEASEGYLQDDPDVMQLSLGLNFEVPVYRRLHQEELKFRKLSVLPVPLDVMYALEGQILTALGRDDEGFEAFLEAHRLNPFSQLPFAYLNRYYEAHEKWNEWLQNIRDEANSVYMSCVLEAFAELARYLAARGAYTKAHACMKYVLEHTIEDETPDDYADLLETIEEKSDDPVPADFSAVCREFGLSEGPNPKVIDGLKDVAAAAEKEKDWDTAEETYELLAELTDDANYETKAEAAAKQADEAEE
jgi:tetratricopeptide (TPR) repeat protein